MSKSMLARAVGGVALLTIVTTILGFLRETSLAAVFGATSDTDAFLMAQTIPYILFSAVGYALTTTFIPVYSRVHEERGREGAFRFAGNVLWAMVAIGALLVLVGELWAEPLVSLVAPGFSGPTAKLTAYLTRIIFPMMLFQLMSGILGGMLETDGRFHVPQAAGLFQNVTVIVAIVLFGPRHGIVAVALGTLAGAAFASFAKLHVLRRNGFRWGFPFELQDPELMRMVRLMMPAILGSTADQLNSLIDRVLASGLPEGRVAALGYAQRLMSLAPAIIGTSIMTVMYPTLAKFGARKDWRSFGDSLVEALTVIYFLLAPIAVGMLVLREPLVRLVFERGAFDSVATQQTAWAFLFLSLSIGIVSMYGLTARGFFVLQDTTTPMIIGAVAVAVNIALNYALIGPLEQGGLTLATTVAGFVGLLLSLAILHRKSPAGLPLDRLVDSVLRTAMAAALMGLGVWQLYPRVVELLPARGAGGEAVQVAVMTGVGAGLYLLLAALFRVPALMFSIAIIRNRLSPFFRRRNAEK